VDDEYKKLRAFLNPAIRGPAVDQLLRTLAVASQYLTENSQAVGDQIYISRASGRYLDQRLADYGLIRPAAVGLSDDVFREIGIAVVNRKQVRDLIMNLLAILFGEEATQATSNSANLEPYQLQDGDTLRVSFDGGPIADIVFEAQDFQNISAAKAQEVADAVTRALRSQGKTGRAFAKDDGDGAYVVLISDTRGPSSSVTVWGGRAQNELVFDKPRPTLNGADTQWTLTVADGSTIRFTWSAGSNPFVGRVRAGDYVNVFGSAFEPENRGTFLVKAAQGGDIGEAYFEIDNPLGSAEIAVQGTADAVLFFQPFRHTLSTKNRFAAVYQEQARLLEVFIPATTRVVRRSRVGAAHVHGEPVFTSTQYIDGSNEITDVTCPPKASIVDGSYFLLNSALDSTEYYVYFDTTGADLNDPAVVGKTGIRVDVSAASTASEVAEALATAVTGVADFSAAPPPASVVRIANLNPGSATDAANVSVTGLSVSVFQQGVDPETVVVETPNPDDTSANNLGPYIYDLSQPFTVSHIGTLAQAAVTPSSGRVIRVADASQFPDAPGHLILGYGTSRQEGPIPYLSRPSQTSLLVNPSYNIQNNHGVNTDVALVAQNSPVVLAKDGSDYQFYLTDVVAGRVYAEDLINAVAATGIQVMITVIYPNDIGLAKYGTPDSDKTRIWGE
jgi:hypothetical protein